MSGSAGFRRWLPAALTGLVLSVLSGFLYQHRGYIGESYSLRPGLFLAVVALTLLALFVRGVANRLHFAGLGVAASVADWFRLVTVTTFTNYLPLSAGLVAKAVFLKRVHGLAFRRFAVGQATLLVLILATNGLVGLCVLALRFPDALAGIVGLGFGAMLAAAGLLVLPERLREIASAKWFPFAANVGPEARRNWPAVALCQVATLLVSALALQLCFEMGDSLVTFEASVLFTSAAVLTRFVTIVPGALGVREFLIGALAVLVGFDLRDAVVASTLVRAAEIAVVFSLGGAFTYSMSRDLVSRDAPESLPPTDVG
jgi:uncharacterized membrane protein YbhN (UPF0104 family)